MWIGILLAIIILLTVLLVSLWAYHLAFFASKKRQMLSLSLFPQQYLPLFDTLKGMMEEMEAIPYQPVAVTAFDGKRLCGRYYHQKTGAPLHIQFHGYRGYAVRDFCGGHKLAREMGHNTLVVDQRAHGKSEGHTITFGLLESKDCLTWVNYAVNRFGKDTEIFLSGISMGASTVLMASCLDLPDNVKGIIADCPFSSPKAIICKVSRDLKIPAAPTYPFAVLGAFLYGHFRLREKECPLQAVKKAKVPILLLHGEADYFVPCDMSREIYAACTAPKTLVTFPGAAHGVSYAVAPADYKRAVDAFVKQYSGKGSPLV